MLYINWCFFNYKNFYFYNPLLNPIFTSANFYFLLRCFLSGILRRSYKFIRNGFFIYENLPLLILNEIELTEKFREEYPFYSS